MHREPTKAEQDAIDTWADNNADDYEYADNHRIAKLDCPEDLAAFEDAETKGCCGSETIYLTTADGIKFMYGFNYGH